MHTTTVSIQDTPYRATIQSGNHEYFADELPAVGGGDSAPSPSEHLLAALGSCTAITLKMYAKNKGWDTGDIKVELSLESPEPGKTLIRRKLFFEKPLETEQLERMMIISGKCPIAKLLSGTIELEVNV